jgi:GTP cyclohydrolase II
MPIQKIGPMKIPSRIAENTDIFDLSLYMFESGNRYYIMSKGEIQGVKNLLCRIDSKCVFAHLFGSARCDCAEQLQESIKRIAKEGQGLLIYCYDQDGRGITLEEHLRVYMLQDQGYDTVEANIQAGLKPDQRNYDEVIEIFKSFDLKEIRLMTNNPQRLQCLEEAGIKVERIPFKVVELDKYNAAQLIVKQTKLGHDFGWDVEKYKGLFNQSMQQKW